MIFQLQYNKDNWFTPRYAINYLARLHESLGEKVLTDNKYKKEREAWIQGVVLLGINKKTNRFWWLQVPKEDPPDMLVMTIEPNNSKGQNEMYYRETEIVEITKYSNEKIDTAILKKLKNKFYIQETALIVYITKDLFIEDMRDIALKLKDQINISDVWVLGALAPDSTSYVLFSLYPEVEVIKFDIKEEMLKIPSGDFLQLSRAKGIKMIQLNNVLISKFIPD